MTHVPVRNAVWLLEQLEDPFTMFPVESVSNTLFTAVDEAEIRKSEEMGPWGVARKFWSVEAEHYHDQIGLLIGAVFVLGQVIITQTVSILGELRKHPEAQRVIPEKKSKILIEHAELDTETRLSQILIINAVSNYFKHVYEWPEEWSTLHSKGVQAETISIVLQIGLAPGAMTDNLLRAADRLALSHTNPRAIARSIQAWREGWARVLYTEFGFPDRFGG